ncbi:ADP-ribose diphosphatase [soil metagenome]
MNHKDVEILQHKTLYQGHFRLEQYHLRFRLFAGGWSLPVTRELFARGSSVAVLPYDPFLDSVVLIEQFRIGAITGKKSPWLQEIVAGVVETGEQAEEVARREAREEAGLILLDLQPICKYWVSPGATSEQVSLFYATVDSTHVSGIHGLIEEGEDIKVKVLPAQEAFAAVKAGTINNAPSIIALQWLQLNHSYLCKF